MKTRVHCRGWRPSILPFLAGLMLVVGCRPPVGPPMALDPPMFGAVESMEVDSNGARREALEAFLEELGVSYEQQSFAIERRNDYPRTEGINLIVTIGSGDRDIVIGGHYDAAWLSDQVLSRGAVDNAASAAILARLASALEDENLRHRIQIVFFDMEEIGLQGSRHYIDEHTGNSIAAAVNLDVNGYGDTIFYGPAAQPGNDFLYELMREHCVQTGLDCVEAPAYPDSDYLSFQRAEIPNISFSLFPAVEARQLWLYLNGGRAAFAPGFSPNVFETIHTPRDTSALVEPAAMELALRSLIGFVGQLDDALE